MNITCILGLMNEGDVCEKVKGVGAGPGRECFGEGRVVKFEKLKAERMENAAAGGMLESQRLQRMEK